MADNTIINATTQAGGVTYRDIDKAGIRTQVVTLDLGGAGAEALVAGSLPVTGAFFPATQPVSGPLTDTQLRATAVPVSAASLPLPTGAATGAAQSTGNASVASIDAKAPALGQALAAASVPVVLTAAQVTTLTPPAAITGFSTEATLALIKAKTDNLDVALSTRAVTGLTDGQLRAAAVPVSAATLPLPAGAATETTVAGLRTDLGTDGTTPPAVLGTGTGVRGWLRSIYEKLTGTLAVTGTFWQATQPVSLATAPTTPVTGTFFQTTQPVSAASLPLPAGAATEATLALVSGTDITTPSPAMPAGGVGIRGWLSAIWTKLNASLAVTGTFWQATQPVSLATAPTTPVTGTFWQAAQPITDNAGSLTVDAPVATPVFVRLSDGTSAIATLPVSLATAPTTPVTGTFWQATQPVSLATNTPDVTDRAARLLGVVASVTAITNALPTGANTIGAVNIAAAQTLATVSTVTNVSQQGGVAISLNTGVRDTGTQRVTIATNDLVPVSTPPSTLHVTAVSTTGAAITATLAAVAGQFHYITNIHLMRSSTAAVTGTAILTHTSANLPGTPNWSVGNLIAAGGTQLDLGYTPTTPLRSAVSNTNTTITMPAGGTGVFNRINISYFTAA